jgi:hypothetical protein
VERDKYIITIPLDNKPLKETTKDTLICLRVQVSVYLTMPDLVIQIGWEYEKSTVATKEENH